MTARRIVLLILGAMAASLAGTALFQPWTRPFTTALTAAAAVMFLLVFISRFDVRVPERRRTHSRRHQKAGRLAFVVCTILMSALVIVAPWQPRADFDVVGVLWLMQNIVPFIGVCILIVAAVVSLGVWLRG